MRALSVPRLLGFVRHVVREPQTTEGDRRVRVQTGLTTPAGIRYDQYEGPGDSRATVMAVHGETLAAEADYRLQHFARCLALSGIRCLTPRLPGLSDLRFDGRDVDALVDVIRVAQRPGIVGFSFGGSIALVAAARPAVASDVRFVLTFGAYHDLRRLFEDHLIRMSEPVDDLAWDDWAYARALLGWTVRDQLAVDPEKLRAFLRGWCHEPDYQVKRRFMAEHLADLPSLESVYARADPTALDAVSPTGKLDGLRCPVGLLQDRADRLVPLAEGRHLRDALAGHPHRYLETSLLSHVDPGGGIGLPGEAVRLLGMLGDVLDPS